MLLSALSGAFGDHPDAVCVAGRPMSWEHLRGAAAAVAGRVAGAPAVAVDATATLETVVAIVGCILAGVPVVPVAPDAGPVERTHLLKDCAAALVLGDPDGWPTPVEAVPVDVTEHGLWSPTEPANTGPARTGPANTGPAVILYTSGTTGPPKGVLLSRDAIRADLDALASAWAWTPDDRLVHGLPLHHVHGLVLGLLGALRTGSRLVHVGRPLPERYAGAGGTLYFGVPTVWSRVCADPAAAGRLAGARLLVSGSAALPVPIFERLRALTGHLPVERYGMTETLITVSTRADGERTPGQVGHALPGIETRIVDDDGALLPADGVSLGELQVRGGTLFSGYLNQPAATAAAYAPGGWFRTGDMATVDPHGVHRVLGRASTDLIKSGGYRIGAGEVEDALLAHPDVREAAVVGVPDDDLGQVIVAYVVADGVTADALIAFVAGTLAWHKRPRRVRFVNTLPRTTMGKVRKGLLPAG